MKANEMFCLKLGIFLKDIEECPDDSCYICILRMLEEKKRKLEKVSEE